ncbi:MAG: O-methyltransferase [Planctomycetes bacterium]|nr:O-methyltransferase [Planctomycetota bacterium]
MSDQSTLVTHEHFAYIAARTTPEDPFLADLKRAADAENIPPINIAPEQAAFMQIMLKLSRAKHVLEVGTLAGYSAIAMARALPPDGRVRTIELSPKHAQFAKSWIARSDVAGKVEVINGPGSDILPTLADLSYDAAFLDADKAGYPFYLEHCLRIVRPGGLIMADNAFAFGQLFDANPTDREAPAVKAFNEIMAAESRLQSVIVPIGDGLWVAVRK